MKKHIPNIITTLNLVCGCAAVILALWGNFWQAFCFIVAATLFDFADGACARLLKVSSEIGRELDSLSDLVSFGVAPAMMLFTWYFRISAPVFGYPTALAFTALLVAVGASLRLARYNIDGYKSRSFSGLPTPASAMIAAPLVAYGHLCTPDGITADGGVVVTLLCSVWFIPVLAVVLMFLMTSRLPMISLKEKFTKVHWIMAAVAVILIPVAAILHPARSGFLGFATLLLALLFGCYVVVALLALPFRRNADK